MAVAAPPHTTAVRFFMDDVALSEITDQYAVAAGQPPQWRTATDARWFAPGTHLLRAEADTPSGTLTAQQRLETASSRIDGPRPLRKLEIAIESRLG